MNFPRFLLAVAVAWLLVFGSDFLIHELWLKADYTATKTIWRPETEMESFMPWLIGAQILCAFSFVFIWANGAAGRSVGAGVVFGLVMGLFANVWVIVNYCVLPIPGALAVKWFCSGLAQAVLIGIATALVYKPRTTAVA